ncbi:g-protein coupled receptor [Trichonephila clavipes]|nr:g-protein coupled receptor [Trichonephila clavipes]
MNVRGVKKKCVRKSERERLTATNGVAAAGRKIIRTTSFGVRKGTWFSESKLAITIILRLTRYWFGKSMNACVVNDFHEFLASIARVYPPTEHDEMQAFILQRAADDHEPGFMYYFLSAISDVAANRFLNSSAIYFSPNMSFTPSYKGFFNKTMPLFAPRAFRSDDFNDPFHLERISTLNTIEAIDLGAIPNNSMSLNYTHSHYKINDWYSAWLPDLTKRQDSKTTYSVQITHGNGTNETFTWHGPPAASDIPGPVKWFKPYFDCGRSNKWVFGATVPIPDIFPRHTQWRHIEIPTYVAVAVMEVDFERIDINQCPTGEGNPPPNRYAGTARCKNQTTECEPIHGYGFRRGGYQCRCLPGYRLPKVMRNPFLGEIVERSPYDQYRKGFNCEQINYLMVMTQNVERLSEIERWKYISRQSMYFDVGNMTGRRIDPMEVVEYVRSPDLKHHCESIAKTHPERLILRGDVAFGKEIQLENEARTALRLANFISSFLQIVDPNDLFAEFRVPDRPLTEDQVIGEVLSAVIGNEKIQGCGAYFDRNQFINKTLFAPYAFRKERNAQNFFVEDLARHAHKKNYLKSEWFKSLKVQWAANTDNLETYTTKIKIRYNSSGLYPIRYDRYPLQYKAAEVKHGYWTAPYFDCGGFHNQWLITYAAPFFGWDKIKSRLEFKGAVAVNMKLEELDINQCDDDYYVQNAFKGSHKCDRRSSRVSNTYLTSIAL